VCFVHSCTGNTFRSLLSADARDAALDHTTFLQQPGSLGINVDPRELAQSGQSRASFDWYSDELEHWPQHDPLNNCCGTALDNVPLFHEYTLQSPYNQSEHRWKTILLFALVMASFGAMMFYFYTQQTTVDHLVADYKPGLLADRMVA